MAEEYNKVVEELMQWDKEKLAQELAKLKLSLAAVNDEAKMFISSYGSYFRGVLRNYTPIEGFIVGVQLEPVAVVLLRETEDKPWGQNKVITELKSTKVKLSSLIYWEIVAEREEREAPPEQTW